MKEKRREFLRKALKITTAATAVGVASSLAANQDSTSGLGNGVVSGKSPKKEVLYHESEAWEKYYKVAY